MGTINSGKFRRSMGSLGIGLERLGMNRSHSSIDRSDATSLALRLGAGACIALLSYALYRRNWKAVGIVAGFFAGLMEKLRDSDLKDEIIRKLGQPSGAGSEGFDEYSYRPEEAWRAP